jgi:hypothetical protein
VAIQACLHIAKWIGSAAGPRLLAFDEKDYCIGLSELQRVSGTSRTAPAPIGTPPLDQGARDTIAPRKVEVRPMPPAEDDQVN